MLLLGGQSQAVCPQRIVFVLKEDSQWHSDDSGQDFVVQLKPPGVGEVLGRAIDAESTYSHWSLFQRFCMVLEVIDAADAAGKLLLCPSAV
jgi:hypothetical protein